MEIIPVIDIMNGIAVSGKSGEREKYTPLKTAFTDSSDPVKIVKNLPYKRLYVADLDAIMKGKPNLETLEELSKIKELMVDVGIKNYHDYERISHLNADIVLGSETLTGLDALDSIRGECGRLIFSIDIKEGMVISPFLPREPLDTFELLSNRIKRFIILNISSVGTLSVDFSLLERLKIPGVEIYYGGGIKKEDMEKLKKIGVCGALIGTALHEGLF